MDITVRKLEALDSLMESLMDNPLEKQLQFSHLGGRAAALEEVAGYLFQCAGDAFATDLDDRAAWYRTLAKEFQKRAREARREQAKYEVIGE